MDFNKLPKIELHCHLDGSVRPSTIIDIANKENISIPSNQLEDITNMLIAPIECKSLKEYLERFEIPIKVMQSSEGLKRISYELLEDAYKENIKYIEVRFAPLLHIKNGLEIEKVIESVLEGINKAEKEFNIKGNLILSCMRNMSVDSMVDVINVGEKFIGKGVVAIDLCANEEEGFCKKFIEPINLARKYGYRVTIHAGETGIGQNVLEAIEMLNAERIGHGIFIKDCLKAYNIVKDNKVALEICPTSNIQTKAVHSLDKHPIYDFYKNGIKVTINTDNRTVSNTTLSNEYSILKDKFNICYKDYINLYLNSIEACFADENTKENLKKFI